MAQNLEARLNQYYPTALSVFRVIFGLLFLCHGLSALIGWPAHDPAHYPAPVGQWPDYYAGWIETVTGALITLGLFTRPAAFLASGEMALGGAPGRLNFCAKCAAKSGMSSGRSVSGGRSTGTTPAAYAAARPGTEWAYGMELM